MPKTQLPVIVTEEAPDTVDRLQEVLEVLQVDFEVKDMDALRFASGTTFPVAFVVGNGDTKLWNNALDRIHTQLPLTAVIGVGQVPRYADVAERLTPDEISPKDVHHSIEMAIAVHRVNRAEQRATATETMLNCLPQRVFIKDRRSVYLACNKRYAEDLGIEPDEIEGLTDYDFFTRVLAERYRTIDRQVIESGKRVETEEEYQIGDVARDVVIVQTPLFDESNEVTRILGSIWDVTERQRSLLNLAQEEKRIKILLELNSMRSAESDKLLAYFLDHAVELTTSEYAFLLTGKKGTRTFVCLGWSGQESFDGKELTIGPESHLGDILERKTPFVGDDLQDLMDLAYVFEVPLTRCMVIPILEKERVVAIAGVVNKGCDYSSFDEENLMALADGFWNVRRLSESEREILKLNESLEKRVIERSFDVLYRVEFERVISEISTSFIGVELDRIDAVIEDTLKKCASFIGAEAGFIFANQNHLTLTHLWQHDDLKLERAAFQKVTYEDLPDWAHQILVGKEIAITYPQGHKHQNAFDISLLQLQGVHSLLGVPLQQEENSSWGFLGVASTRSEREWTSDELRFVRFVSQILVNAMQRKRIETAYLVSSAKYKMLFEQMLDGFVLFEQICDDHGRIVDFRILDANPAFETQLGLRAEDVVGKTLKEAMPGVTEDWWQLFRKAMCADRPIRCEKYAQMFNRYYEVLIFSPQRHQLACVFQDITERKCGETTLIDAKEKAEIASRAKSEFLANMGHELRTPLNAVIGFSDLLQADQKDDEVREYAESINSAGKNLLTMINDILDLARIDTGRMSIRPAPSRISVLLSELQQLYEAPLREKGLDFETRVADEMPPVFLLDQEKLRQILSKLLSNALKFTSDGRVLVEASAQETDKDRYELRFVVEDTGIGIAEDQQEQIYEAFTQSSMKDTKTHSGTGLGLAVSRRIVDMMGGEIALHSRVGQGSRFTVILRDVRAREHGAERSQTATADIASAKRVLIADDVASNRKMLARILEKSGFETRCAEDGEEAVAIFDEFMPTVCILDIRMPNKDGIEAFREIRERKGGKRIPIIALTASNDERERDQVMAVGFTDFLTKPIDATKLFATLDEHILEPHKAATTAIGTAAVKLDPDDFDEHPELLNDFRKQFRKQLNRIRGGNSIAAIQSTIAEIAQFAETNHFEPLRDWARQAHVHINRLQIKKINLAIANLIKATEGPSR